MFFEAYEIFYLWYLLMILILQKVFWTNTVIYIWYLSMILGLSYLFWSFSDIPRTRSLDESLPIWKKLVLILSELNVLRQNSALGLFIILHSPDLNQFVSFLLSTWKAHHMSKRYEDMDDIKRNMGVEHHTISK